MGFHLDPQSSTQLVNQSQRANHSSHEGYYQHHSERPSPCLGMVQREPNPRLGRDHSDSQPTDCQELPLLTDLVWLQEVSPFWNFMTDVPRIDGIHCPLRIRSQPSPELRLKQFLEEVYSAILTEFEERKVLLSPQIYLEWKGNVSSIKLAQTAKCVPKFGIVIRNSELKGAGFLAYHFKMTAFMNTIWEIWPE